MTLMENNNVMHNPTTAQQQIRPQPNKCSRPSSPYREAATLLLLQLPFFAFASGLFVSCECGVLTFVQYWVQTKPPPMKPLLRYSYLSNASEYMETGNRSKRKHLRLGSFPHHQIIDMCLTECSSWKTLHLQFMSLTIKWVNSGEPHSLTVGVHYTTPSLTVSLHTL